MAIRFVDRQGMAITSFPEIYDHDRTENGGRQKPGGTPGV
jgi:hypothetical protein